MVREYGPARVVKTRETWRARIRYRDNGGPWREVSKSTGVSAPGSGTRGKATAQKVADRWRAELVASSATKATLVTVGEYAVQCLERLATSGAVEPSTIRAYRYPVKLVCQAPFSHLPLGEVTAEHVQAWERDLREEVSGVTVRKAHVRLKAMYAEAVEDGLVASTPFTRRVKPPALERKAPNVLDEAGRARVLGMLSESRDPVAVAAVLAMRTGMRRGELCGLKWEDVTNRTIIIRRSVGLGADGTSARPYVKTPKTGISRVIPVGPDLGAYLEPMRRDAGCYVLTGTSAFANPTELGRRWSSVAHVLNLVGTRGRVVTLHDLRHTFATLAVRSTDPVTAAALLGHASPTMTLDVYAATDEQAMVEAVEHIEKAT